MRAPANDSSGPGSEARNHGFKHSLWVAQRYHPGDLLVYVCVSRDLFRNDTINNYNY